MLEGAELFRLNDAGPNTAHGCPAGVTDAYSTAITSFREAATSAEPIQDFVIGIRAMCVGIEAGSLPLAERDALLPLITRARLRVIRSVTDLATAANRQADLPDVIGPVTLTVTFALLWGPAQDDLETFEPYPLAERCAQVRIAANMLESIARSSWSAPIPTLSSGRRH